jgi:alpha-L-rhamnosidase
MIMNRIILFLAIQTLFGCQNLQTNNATDQLTGEGDAFWIGDGKEAPAEDSLFYLDDPAPMFRKEFSLNGELQSARLLITAAGYYRATINGRRAGNNMLDPAWTEFGKRVYYSEYDIKDLLSDGNNCIGVVLGKGFYDPLPMKMWGNKNLRVALNVVGRPVFIGKLILEYKNGKKEVIKTDDSWHFEYGPIIKNNVYLGEVYDAGREIKGWDLPGFDDSSWTAALIQDGPGGTLQKTFFPPVQVTGIITPVEIYSPREGLYIADMGVNFTGVQRIRLKGDPGDSVVFRFGERIYEDGTLNPMTTVCGQIKRPGIGGPGAPDTAWQTDTYIIGTPEEEWYSPEFTFHTYRYMEIAGLKYNPQIKDIEGLSLNSNVAHINSFSSSSDLINSIQKATERTFLANLISVQSDCPAREKFGYGGDLNATCEAFIYNFDMQSFYRKTVYDWVDAINDSIFIDTAPFVDTKYCGLSWESAFIITQYYLYLYYNDTEFIKELYNLDKQWMEKAARIHPEGIVDAGLGDHESLEPVPSELVGTCHYLFCARIMQQFASLMNDKEGEEQYRQLAEKLKTIIRKEFWEKPVEGKINRQTLFASLLYYDIVTPEEAASAVDSLMKAVTSAPAGHFTTGIFGTKYILEAISRHLSPEKVFEIVNSTEYPGWGHMTDRGATTIWETWKESDNTYSNCHPMFGSVSEWFYRWLGGIRPDPRFPGFTKFHLAPCTPKNLDHVNCTYHSPEGKIVSNWKKENNQCIYHFEIPAGLTAMVDLAVSPTQTVSLTKTDDPGFEAGTISGLQSGKFDLKEGRYQVVIE